MSRERLRRTVALEYRPPDGPVVVAQGTDPLAARLIEQADLQGLPLTEDAARLGRLARLDASQPVPESLCVTVAAVLSWVGWLEELAADAPPAQSPRRPRPTRPSRS